MKLRSLRGIKQVLNWRIYPDSPISRIKSPPLRGAALVWRNTRDVARWLRFLATKDDPYLRLVKDEYDRAIILGLFYVESGGVAGEIAEFGTHGVTAATICEYLKVRGFPRQIHMFDTFEGFPEPIAKEDLDSPHIKANIWRKGGAHGRITPAELRRELGRKLPQRQIRTFEGLYKDTLPTVPAGTKYSLLLMDCCLYQSHKEALYYLFTNAMVAEGALIMFSDWCANQSRLDCGPRKAWREAVKAFEIDNSDAGSYCWGGQKFIVHSYGRTE